MEMNFRVFMEPRGFIRVIQFVMSIFAFATTSGYSSTCSYQVLCSMITRNTSTPNPIFEYTIGYPFSYFNIETIKECPAGSPEAVQSRFSLSSSATFFVATGVLSFLYTIGISVVYGFAQRLYESNQMTPIVDLGISGVLSIFWISGASAWAQGVSDLKYYSSLDGLIRSKVLPICGTETSKACEPVNVCKYATLNVSLIFGFANFALWVASMWFVYKETIFHQQPQMPPGGQPPQTFPQQQFPSQEYPPQQYPPQQYPPQQYSPTETKLGGQI